MDAAPSSENSEQMFYSTLCNNLKNVYRIDPCLRYTTHELSPYPPYSFTDTIEIPNRRFSPNTVGTISIFILTTQ